jgi:alpha-beta hydrolase superfamily lysophospholipase
MTFTFRGCGTSEGDFSLQGWVDDLRAAIDHLIAETSPIGHLAGRHQHRRLHRHLRGRRRPAGPWCRAAQPPRRLRRLGRATAPVPRARSRDRCHPHARLPRTASTNGRRELRRFRPVDAARRFAPRPLLVMHGDDDESVPTADARQLAEAHGSAELRLINGAGHRCVTTRGQSPCCSGWLDRQRTLDAD